MPDRTGTEVLVDAMETFSTHEPEVCMILWTDTTSGFNCKSNTTRVMALGMLEAAKDMILKAGDD
jgi:hypothetical protein